MKTLLVVLTVAIFAGCATNSDGINSKSCTIKPPKSDKNYTDKPTFGTKFGKKD